MTQPLEKPGPEQPFLEPVPTEGEAANRLWGSKFWFQLLLVRPWLLVGTFWLLSVVVGVFALEGIVKPKPLAANRAELGEVAGSAATKAPPSSAVQPFVTPQPVLSEPGVESVKTRETSIESGVPVWSLSAMVAACAVGCVMLSRWRKLEKSAVRTRRSRSPRAGSQTATVPGSGVSKPSTQQLPFRAQPRLVPLSDSSLDQRSGQRLGRRSDRRRRGPISARPMVSTQRLPSRPYPSPGQTRSSHLTRSTQGRQPVISVVPASESHALDWPEGSLAHQLDVRAKRSLSSFL